MSLAPVPVPCPYLRKCPCPWLPGPGAPVPGSQGQGTGGAGGLQFFWTTGVGRGLGRFWPPTLKTRRGPGAPDHSSGAQKLLLRSSKAPLSGAQELLSGRRPSGAQKLLPRSSKAPISGAQELLLTGAAPGAQKLLLRSLKAPISGAQELLLRPVKGAQRHCYESVAGAQGALLRAPLRITQEVRTPWAHYPGGLAALGALPRSFGRPACITQGSGAPVKARNRSPEAL